jgi:thiol-disulfide isomerase/thioredoxin
MIRIAVALAAWSLGLNTVAASVDDLEQALEPAPGHFRLVHLWASWCRPCLMEWPALAKSLRRTSRKGLDVVIVSVDGVEGTEAAASVLSRLGSLPGRSIQVPLEEALPFIEALDPEWDGALPTTLLLDPEAHVVFAQHGGTDLRALERQVEENVGRSPPPHHRHD